MTREEILAMEVGRELDVPIAERVMGWQKPRDPSLREEWVTTLFHPSADISAAWLVWEKMKVSGFWAKFIKAIDSLSPTESYMPLLSLAETINPENICKAALLTKLPKEV